MRFLRIDPMVSDSIYTLLDLLLECRESPALCNFRRRGEKNGPGNCSKIKAFLSVHMSTFEILAESHTYLYMNKLAFVSVTENCERRLFQH